MSPQIATIIGLVIMFIVATALPINMGAVAFAPVSYTHLRAHET